MLDVEGCPKELIELYGVWLSDGGKSTLEEYLQLSEEEQKNIIKTIKGMKKTVEVNVRDKHYLLAHTVPGIDRVANYTDWTLEECILGEPNYEKRYFEDKYVVTGHTPTGFIEKESVGRYGKEIII